MKDLSHSVSITRAFWIAVGVQAWALAASAAPLPAACASAPADAGTAAFPTFCSIPQTPTDVRDAKAFRSNVVATRWAGRHAAEESAAVGFQLTPGQTETFAAAGRSAATPPPAVVDTTATPTDQFAADARKRAAPPARQH